MSSIDNTKPVLFISDTHLGSRCCTHDSACKLIDLLNSVAETVKEIYLVGDIFDFWIDYNHLVSSDFIEVLSALKSLTRRIDIHYIKGNHDFYLGQRFEEITGCRVYKGPVTAEIHGKKVIIEHGNCFLKTQAKDRLVLGLLENPVAQWLYKLIPPGIGIRLAHYISGVSRNSRFTGISSEERQNYAKRADLKLSETDSDIIILGHTHYPEIYKTKNGIYMNIGDMCEHMTYGRIINGKPELLNYTGEVTTPIPYPPESFQSRT